ncbi:MAG: NADH-quinone oxidoreductase subunit L [Candidatus Zixiibacteriota bacterium]
MLELAYLIPLYPILAFAIIIFFTRWNERLSAGISISAILLGFVHSVGVMIAMLGRGGAPLEMAMPFINHPFVKLELGMWIDPLTAVMLLVVTIVASCVHIYSLGYMHGDPRFSRFFAYLSLFSFSMLGLVIANNFFMIFVFWELVGVSSYFLIGFWFEKDSAANAGKKAFITNRVGDFGFLIGLMILAYYAGTLNYQELFAKITSGSVDGGIISIAGVFVFCGAVGKSAQFPLHVWLPDAMEGPTPVSALIHAATMVAAGVYMVARGMTLFAGSETASMVIAVIGLITSFMAASIAFTQNDIKRVLAYSTCSQLGYMIMALGLYGVDYATAMHHGGLEHFHSPGWYAGTFHLMTHAFFKALMFLGAGSVIHAVHTNDMREMGGLYKKMSITSKTFIIGALSISGIFPLAGFWSKDEIVATTFANGHWFFMAVTLFIAGMTAFYMFRLIFMTFFGEPRDQHRFDHAHESPKSMAYPLIVLAILAVGAGWVGMPWLPHGFASFVFHAESGAYHPHASYMLMIISTAVALFGIGMAYLIYYKKSISADAIAEKIKPLYKFSYNKWYIDELYEAAIIGPTLAFTRFLWWFDANIIDGLVNFIGWLTVKWSDLKMWFDKYIIDGAVNGAGYICQTGGWFLKFLQSGSVQFYTMIVIASTICIVIYKITPRGALAYAICLVFVALLRIFFKMIRPAGVESDTNIEV